MGFATQAGPQTRIHQGHAEGGGARAGERQMRAAGRAHRTLAHALLGGQRGRERAQLGAQAPQQRQLGLARQLVQRRLCAAGAHRAMRLDARMGRLWGGFLS